MRHVHIVPVNSDKDTVLDSIKQSGYPVQRVYLVIQGNKERTAKELEETLSVLFDVNKLHVDSEAYASIYEMLRAVKKEEDRGNRVYINITDSPELLIIACYITAQLSGCKLYKVGEEREVIEIKMPPLKKISEDKLKIVKTLRENGGEISSISEVIDLLEGLVGEDRKYMAQRAKMKYRLDTLESDGLIKLTRTGKQVKVELTELGWAYSFII